MKHSYLTTILPRSLSRIIYSQNALHWNNLESFLFENHKNYCTDLCVFSHFFLYYKVWDYNLIFLNFLMTFLMAWLWNTLIDHLSRNNLCYLATSKIDNFIPSHSWAVYFDLQQYLITCSFVHVLVYVA